MPRKSSKPVQEKLSFPVGKYYLEEDAPWGGFINIKLDDDAHDAFDVWNAAHHNEIAQLFIDLMAEAIKVGFAYDSEHQCFITTFTGALVDGDKARYCMTTRAGTWDECLALSLWKHTVMAQGNYRDFLPRSGTFKSWG